jgi:glyoxylase I family protein
MCVTWNVFVQAADGTMLEIIPAEGPRPAANAKTPGFRHLAIKVEDFDAACRDLESKGVKFHDPPREVEGARLVFFDDADGNIVHLIHRGPAE